MSFEILVAFNLMMLSLMLLCNDSCDCEENKKETGNDKKGG